MTNIENSIAFLGPVGTYTHEAARSFAGRLGLEEPAMVECTSFDEVFDCVDRGRAAFGVVGKENSLEGSVTATLDNFAFRSSAVILAEKVIDIHHCLVVHPDAALEEVTRVASHPQGLAQCRRFLNEKLPGRSTPNGLIDRRERAPSLCRIARRRASPTPSPPSFTARASPSATSRTHFGNQTSFALIGRPGSAPQLKGERYKTTLALFLQSDKAGALNMILSEFAYANINLTMIQSRPTKQQLGDYMFFVEFEGSTNDLAVQTALNCLRLKLREVKVLGSYPVE